MLTVPTQQNHYMACTLGKKEKEEKKSFTRKKVKGTENQQKWDIDTKSDGTYCGLPT
eukprot:m.195650 g.195650  ORF g.195650 m.195650 type:complete len:57 (-) comp32577_c0_seq2:184-354(-)